jgi:transcriptional regulator with XRE-family HTH domain
VTQSPMADGVPGRQHLTGYRLRNYDHAIAVIDRARESRGLSINQLAGRVGLSGQSMSWNLRGKHRMDGRNLLAAFDALGYDLALIPREDA